MRRLSAIVFALALVLAVSATAVAAKPGGYDDNGNVTSQVADTGFNENGYNYNARIFSGPADGVDKVLDGKVWGDPTYAADRLVMKWNAAWDACNANGYDDATYCAGAWTTNEWNGMVPGGSGWTEHVKIIWVGSQANHGLTYWVEGGTRIWGNYEVIFDQGRSADNVHAFWAHGIPAGLGG
jgi:hypothetical protein